MDSLSEHTVRKLNWAVTGIVVLIVVLLMFQTSTMYNEENLGPQTCEMEFGEGASWVNDTDDTLDCRLPNGTVVEDVPIELKQASDDVAHAPASISAE